MNTLRNNSAIRASRRVIKLGRHRYLDLILWAQIPISFYIFFPFHLHLIIRP